MNLRIEKVRNLTDPPVGRIMSLFEDMYAEMATLGPVKPLVPDGARIWMDGILPGLERFGRLNAALNNDEVVAFAHGTLKLGQAYQAGMRTGVITHVHVVRNHRRQGVARALVQDLLIWFEGKQVDVVEIDVVIGNEQATEFWRSIGFEPDLIQLSKRIVTNDGS